MKNQDLIKYAIASYSFVLPINGSFTFQAWAEAIKSVYDSANVRHSAVIAEIEKLSGTVVRRFGVSAATWQS